MKLDARSLVVGVWLLGGCFTPGPVSGCDSISGTPGERSTGACPTGEHCDPAVPYGLGFANERVPSPAVWALTSGLSPIAVGGQSCIHMNAVDARHFAIPVPAYDASASPAGIFTIASGGTGTCVGGVELQAVAAGDALLRITGATDGLLLDRAPVSVRDAFAVDVVPFPILAPTATPSRQNIQGWYALPGASVVIAPRIAASDGTALASEGVMVTVVDGVTVNRGLTPLAGWPSVTFAMDGSAGRFQVDALGHSFPVTIPTVTHVTSLSLESGAEDAPTTHLALGTVYGVYVCAMGRLGDAFVMLTSVDAHVDGVGTVDTTSDGACIQYSSTVPGHAEITFTAAGATAVLPVDVTAATGM